MNKNEITITVDNYKGKKFIYTMPSSAYVEIWRNQVSTEDNQWITTEIGIEAKSDKGIETKKED